MESTSDLNFTSSDMESTSDLNFTSSDNELLFGDIKSRLTQLEAKLTDSGTRDKFNAYMKMLISDKIAVITATIAPVDEVKELFILEDGGVDQNSLQEYADKSYYSVNHQECDDKNIKCVIAVNGGDEGDAQLELLIEAAKKEGILMVYTGKWGGGKSMHFIERKELQSS
ncbi:hypothetical protein [Cysteiniphilum sp. JM-1]|uniref:hypothetical protein n=1 Tax=Cysteiniphilum sp. JM-1 TaxID=2610891 RepID=UPI0012469BEE|nr:hypothetical protein [Cysteiniphilum sp. JM-1]